jgi:hypothetical protein
MIMKCDAPGANCPHPAKQLLMARAGENLVGNGMAVWTAYWRCGLGHRVDEDSARMRSVDPEVQILVFVSETPLDPGAYVALAYNHAQ